MRGHDVGLDRRGQRAASGRSRNGSSTPATQPMAKPSAETRKVAMRHRRRACPLRASVDDALRRHRAAARRTAGRACARPAPSPASSSSGEQRAARRSPPDCARHGAARRTASQRSMPASVIARPPGCVGRSRQSPAARRCPARCAGAGSGSRARRRSAPAAAASTSARSPSAIASVMSWVTNTMVLRPRSHSRSRSCLQLRAGLRVDRARTARPSG